MDWPAFGGPSFLWELLYGSRFMGAALWEPRGKRVSVVVYGDLFRGGLSVCLWLR